MNIQDFLRTFHDRIKTSALADYVVRKGEGPNDLERKALETEAAEVFTLAIVSNDPEWVLFRAKLARVDHTVRRNDFGKIDHTVYIRRMACAIAARVEDRIDS